MKILTGKSMILVVNNKKQYIFRSKHMKERQIPMKPKEHYDWFGLTPEQQYCSSRWYCGRCELPIYKHHEFCEICEQKVDWI